MYGKTRADVREKLNKARDPLDAGAAVKDSKRTLADWLAHWRATTLAASDRKESTRELYANLCRRHLEREPFGTIRLDKLKPSDVEALVLAMRASTESAKPTNDDTVPQPIRALSDSTIRQTYTVLQAALDGAVRDGLLAKNPAAAVRRPGIGRPEAKHASAVDVTKLLLCAEGSALPDRSRTDRGDRVAARGGAGVALVRGRPGRRSAGGAGHPRKGRRKAHDH